MFLPVIASAQYVTAFATNQVTTDITIGTNQVVQVLNFTHDGVEGLLNVTKGATSQSVLRSTGTGAINGPAAVISMFFAGPATITIAGQGNGHFCLSYKLFDNSTSAGTNLPSNTVVIPADAGGNVDIILESSTDLVTWTAATPGSYGSSTSKRFFRIRAVAH